MRLKKFWILCSLVFLKVRCLEIKKPQVQIQVYPATSSQGALRHLGRLGRSFSNLHPGHFQHSYPSSNSVPPWPQWNVNGVQLENLDKAVHHSFHTGVVPKLQAQSRIDNNAYDFALNAIENTGNFTLRDTLTATIKKLKWLQRSPQSTTTTSTTPVPVIIENVEMMEIPSNVFLKFASGKAKAEVPEDSNDYMNLDSSNDNSSPVSTSNGTSYADPDPEQVPTSSYNTDGISNFMQDQDYNHDPDQLYNPGRQGALGFPEHFQSQQYSEVPESLPPPPPLLPFQMAYYNSPQQMYSNYMSQRMHDPIDQIPVKNSRQNTIANAIQQIKPMQNHSHSPKESPEHVNVLHNVPITYGEQGRPKSSKQGQYNADHGAAGGVYPHGGWNAVQQLTPTKNSHPNSNQFQDHSKWLQQDSGLTNWPQGWTPIGISVTGGDIDPSYWQGEGPTGGTHTTTSTGSETEFFPHGLFTKLKDLWGSAKTKITNLLSKNGKKDPYSVSQKVYGKSISIMSFIAFGIYVLVLVFQAALATLSLPPFLTNIFSFINSSGGLGQVFSLIFGGRRRQQFKSDLLNLNGQATQSKPVYSPSDDDFIDLERKVRSAFEFFASL